jgi:hypothetical protein
MWQTYSLDDNKWYCWQLGGSEAYIKKTAGNSTSFLYELAFKQASIQSEAGAIIKDCAEKEPAEDIPRKILAANTGTIEIAIDFPVEPYVVSTQVPVVLESNTCAVFAAPLCPIIDFAVPGGAVLSSCFPFRAFKTWWGRDVTSGKFCYSLPNSLVQLYDKLVFTNNYNPLLVLCPVIIKNNSKKLFAIEKIRLDTEQLSIYEAAEKNAAPHLLFSDIIEIEVADNEWHINVRNTDTNNNIYNLLCNDRVVRCVSTGIKNDAGKIIRRRSAEFIKNITQF